MNQVVDNQQDQSKDYETPTWSSFEDLGSGIFVYRNVLPQELEIIKRLEDNLDKGNPRYRWMEAFVGYNQSMPEYRDCVDFKFKKADIVQDPSQESLNLQALWQDCYDRQKPAVNHYQKMFNIGELRYWEAMNFIKYNKGQHFQYHHDHGFSYNCTVSLVAYPNDDYTGGELSFAHQGLVVTPKAGDLYIFPSNYMYSHRAMPVHSGTKYSIVTMLDYSAKYHTPDLYRETGD